MKIGTHHSKYIASKIALDLSRGSYINLLKDLDSLISAIDSIILNNLENEKNIEDYAKQLIEEYQDDIEYNFADERELFKMIKIKLAEENGFLTSYEDRFSDLSHYIVETIIENQIIEPRVSYIKLASSIFDSIDQYFKSRTSIEDIVANKMKKTKRNIEYGSSNYFTLFNELYEEELRSRGAF